MSRKDVTPSFLSKSEQNFSRMFLVLKTHSIFLIIMNMLFFLKFVFYSDMIDNISYLINVTYRTNIFANSEVLYMIIPPETIFK